MEETPFADPAAHLGNWNANQAARVLSGSSEVVLVMDDAGVVLDAAIVPDLAQLVVPEGTEAGADARAGRTDAPPASPNAARSSGWIGRKWIDLVTLESQPKVVRLIAQAKTEGGSDWAELNHTPAADLPSASTDPDDGGAIDDTDLDVSSDIPLHYRVVRLRPSASANEDCTSDDTRAGGVADGRAGGRAGGKERKTSKKRATAAANEAPASQAVNTPALIAFGRDLRPIARLQAQLVQAQQTVDRDYHQLRHAETRYRALFHQTREPVLIIDAHSEKVLEANRAASDALTGGRNGLVGRTLAKAFHAESRDDIRAMIMAVRSAGQVQSVKVATIRSDACFELDARLYRQDQSAFVLIIMSRAAPDEQTQDEADTSAAGSSGPMRRDSNLQRTVISAIDTIPDGFLLLDADGRVMFSNTAFLELINGSVETAIIGQGIGRWVGHPGADWPAIRRQIDEDGRTILFPTTLTSDLGVRLRVEVSGVSLASGEGAGADAHAPGPAGMPGGGYGLVIRNVDTRIGDPSAADQPVPAEMPSVVEQMTKLVGRVPLKDLVRDTTDIIERMCIEAALASTKGNRASASEMLGLSRQSLYVKLRRYGIGEGEDGGDDSAS